MSKPLGVVPSSGEIGEHTPTDRLIAWSLERFRDRRIVLTTAFGMEGCALIHMYAALQRPLTVVYLDTGFLFPETYALIRRLEERYPHLSFVNRGTGLTPDAQAALYGPALWRADPDLCCRLRKVDPMREVLRGADVWITAITREQGGAREQIRLVAWDWQFEVIKICPLAAWTRRQIVEYILANQVPHNPLHAQGYPSIGCTHCTLPVRGLDQGQYSRAGRWSGTQKTECGLHAPSGT